MRDIGKNIRQTRIANGLTQDDLAQRIHATRQTVSNYETGRSQPDIDTLMLLADALEVNMEQLLYGQAKPAKIRFTTLPLSAVLGVLLMLAEPALTAIIHSPVTTEKAAAFIRPLALGARFLGVVMLGWVLLDLLLLLTKHTPAAHRWRLPIRRGITAAMTVYIILLLLNMFLLPFLSASGFTLALSAMLLRISNFWPLAGLLGVLRRYTLPEK